MEVLDPSLSRDNQPLCVNDEWEEKVRHDDKGRVVVEDTRSCIKARYTFGFMGFLGFALVYAMRVNLSIAIVSMVNQTETDKNVTDVCPQNPDPVNATFPPVNTLRPIRIDSR